MKTIDTDQILSKISLRDVLRLELGEPNRAGNWRCPFHKEKSASFGIVASNKSLFHCFGCGRSGDAISFLRERRGLSFRDACERLAGSRSLPEVVGASPPPPRATVRQSEAPPPTWSSRALEVATEAERCLWTPAGLSGLDYLRGRGFTDATIRAAGLGWIAADLRDPPAVWGLPADNKPVWTPAGVAIPWRSGGDVNRLNIRRLTTEGPKYCGPAGWRSCLYQTPGGDGRAAVLVEGELDALAVHQATGGRVAGIATGSATGGRVASCVYHVASLPGLLLLFDSDPAGAEAATWWKGRISWAKVGTLPGGRDPASTDPETLRETIFRAMPDARPPEPFPPGWEDSFSDEQLERLAVRTICGQMSDSEALAAENLAQPGAIAGTPHATKK